MAPKVVVPADFGRRHIGSPSHGNLTFNLEKGVQVKANSIILSLNSPVIDDLTSSLHLLSLEADDFSRDAVDCFVEAAYTGEAEAVNLKNFRDVNKMSRVFQVGWLVAKCKEYFVSHLDKLSGKSNFSTFSFVVEESLYLVSALKNHEFFDLVVRKMSSISAWKRSYFSRRYLHDLSSCNFQQIDICLKILSPELIYVIVKLLLSHLTGKSNKSFDQNSRYILNKIDIRNCFLTHPDLGEQLFSVLENFENYSTEDSRLFLSLLKQKCTSTVKNCETTEIKDITPLSFPLFNRISNDSDLDGVLQYLVESKTINNMYLLFDLVWSYLFERRNVNFDLNLIVDKMIAIKEANGWKSLEFSYVSHIRMPCSNTSTFVNIVLKSGRIVSKSDSSESSKSTVLGEYSGSQFVNEIFTKDREFEFYPSGEKCIDKKCILGISSVKDNKPDSFSMNVKLSDPSLTAHLVLEWLSPKLNDWRILPISWCSRPLRYTPYLNCEERWIWGYLIFRKDISKNELIPDLFPWSRYLVIRGDRTCRLRIITES